jgi:hypothetical protein
MRSLLHPISPSTIFVAIPGGLVVLGLLAALAYLRSAVKHGPTQTSGQTNRLLLYSMIFVGTICFISIGDQREQIGEISIGVVGIPRYMLPLVPSTVLLSTEFLYVIHKYLNLKNRQVLYIGLCVYFLFLTTETVNRQYKRSLTKGTYGTEQPIIRTYERKKQIFQDLAQTFNLGAEDFLFRTSLVYQKEKKWIGAVEPSQFLATTMFPYKRSSNQDGCFMVVESPSIQTENFNAVRKQLTGPQFRSDLGYFIKSINQIELRTGYALVHYNSLKSDCPKSLINDYILTQDEQRILDTVGLSKPRGNPVVITRKTEEDTVFIASVPMKESNVPLTFMLKIRLQSDGSVSYDFIAKAFRNITLMDTGPCLWDNCGGYFAPAFTDRPYLTFERMGSATKTVLLTGGTLGQGLFRTPLHGKINFSDNGHYKLSLMLPNIRTLRREGKDMNISLGTIEIKN